QELHVSLGAYYEEREFGRQFIESRSNSDVTFRETAALVGDAHASAMMLILLFTGVRVSETWFLMQGTLKFQTGYWFIESKVVKGRSKLTPIVLSVVMIYWPS
ncbi:MAG: hypothetical protein JZU65_09670, partial [Chlorobium sp.]|nr:hypothetical protein [Chlorobium sp.]